MESATNNARTRSQTWWEHPGRTFLGVSPILTCLQLLGDVASCLAAYGLAKLLWPLIELLPGLERLHESIPESNWSINAVVTLCAMLPLFQSIGLYREHHSLLNIREYQDVLKGWFLTMLLTLLAVSTIERSFQSRGIFLTVWVLLLSFLLLERFAVYRLGIRLRSRGWRDRGVLIYGTGQSGRGLAKRLRASPKAGLEILGFLEDAPEATGSLVEGIPVLGTGSDLARLVQATGASEVLVALPRASRLRLLRIAELCRRDGIRFRIMPSLFDIAMLQVESSELGGIPLIGVHSPGIDARQAVLKRAMDLAFTLPVLTLAALPMLLIAALVAILDGRPILFRQIRVGQSGRKFAILKFRTMRTDAPRYAPSPDHDRDPRVTALGRFLRRTSLDELPQLWNILRGDMSLVGPRPEMPFVVETYDAIQRLRLRAKPGLTGLWQISPDRQDAIHLNIDYDLYYLRHQSLLLDLAILAKTLASVVRGQGAL